MNNTYQIYQDGVTIFHWESQEGEGIVLLVGINGFLILLYYYRNICS